MMQRLFHNRLRPVLAGAFLALCAPTPILANVPDCEALAARAAAAAGIPEGLLPSIARVESGRGQGAKGRKAWPWTLNQGGKGMYFDTRDEAVAYLRDAVASGVRNIDVGCMQINYRWHGDQFASLDAMMDPVSNTRYGARFLTELHGRLGSWQKATGHYHSATPERSAHYRKLVARVLEKMPAADVLMASLDTAFSPTAQPAAPQRQTAELQPGGPIVAVSRSPQSAYMLAMTGGGVLPESATPTFRSARADAMKGKADAPRQLQRRWNQIESLRQEFATQAPKDG